MIHPILAEYISENYPNRTQEIHRTITDNSRNLLNEPGPNQTYRSQTQKTLGKTRKEIAGILQKEGYADSYECALAIAEAMSDEWLNEVWTKPETWEMIMKGHDVGSRAARAVGTSMNAANTTGPRSLNPSTLANMEKQARKLEKTNPEGYSKAKAIRSVARNITKLTPQERRANWFANRQELVR